MPHNRKAVLQRLGRSIRQERKRQEISQEQLALRAEVDRAYMGGVERGEENISIVTMQRIADVLKVRASALMEKAGL